MLDICYETPIPLFTREQERTRERYLKVAPMCLKAQQSFARWHSAAALRCARRFNPRRIKRCIVRTLKPIPDQQGHVSPVLSQREKKSADLKIRPLEQRRILRLRLSDSSRGGVIFSDGTSSHVQKLLPLGNSWCLFMGHGVQA